MAGTRWAMAGVVLLALLRALTVVGSLAILFFLTALIVPTDRLVVGKPGPSGAAMAGGSGDPGAESDSPEPYVTFDFFWELPTQGPNVSEASPAGLKNESGLGNMSWPLTEPSEFMTLLKEALPVLESELVDKEAPQEDPQAVPVPEGNSKDLEPTGVVKRFSGAEDTKTDPNTVEGMTNTGTDDAKFTWTLFARVILVAMVYSLIMLLIVTVIPEWAQDVKRRYTALRAYSEHLKNGNTEFMV